MSKYKITVIVAIYNMEAYLKETIESVIAQDIGFENVELILVNDGSTDNSAAICREYDLRYKNVIYIEKENGGVSSARNEGIAKAKGELINFLDADDWITSETFLLVYKYYKKHKKHVDVLSIPMFHFGAREREHILNDKFEQTHIVDMYEEPSALQLSVSSSFVARKAIKNAKFNINMKYGEDTDFLTRILYNKMKYAVVSEGKYMYRYRESGDSAMQASKNDVNSYINLMQSYEQLIKTSLEKFDSVPLYMQHLIVYNVGWRIRKSNVDSSVLTQLQIEEFLSIVGRLFQYVEDSVILKNNFLNIYYKIYELEIKYSKNIEEMYTIIRDENYVLACFDSYLLNSLSNQVAHIDSIDNRAYDCIIKGRMSSVFPRQDLKVMAHIEGHDYPAEIYEEQSNNIYSLNQLVRKVIMYEIRVGTRITSVEDIEMYVEYCGQKHIAKVKGEDVEYVDN